MVPTHAIADFTYNDFSDVSGLSLNGDAAQSGTILRLTPNLQGQSGTAWYTVSKAHLADGFETTFTFQMSGGGADGMAFVIQDSSPSALGGGGSGLGYQNIQRCLAVELDTFGFQPETDNHVSIQTVGLNGNSPDDAFSLGLYNAYPDLNDATLHTLRIVYRPGFMLVFLDSIPAPVLNITLDLQNINGENILDESGDAWVGFSAGTGGAFQAHDVTSWSFDETSAPLPTGGCCVSNACMETTARNCGPMLNGHYAGDGTDCENVTCIGACCFGFECWFDAPLEDCVDSNGGTFMGVGSSCSTVSCLGACCTANGQCVLADQFDCENNYAGAFHGAGTSCTPFPCFIPLLGGCCVDGVCELGSEFSCTVEGGVWYGLGVFCPEINCNDPPGPFGACCQPGSGNVCRDGITQTACEHFNGTYNGDASLCENSNCTDACDCQFATPIVGSDFINDTTLDQPVCGGVECNGESGSSPSKVYAFTATESGLGLIEICNFVDFDAIISVHSGCPLTEANQITCDHEACGLGAQVTFCADAGSTYYARVGGVGGASGSYDLFAFVIAASLSEGPFQNPANGHWYYLTSFGSWTATEQIALSKGGHLATINDAAENEWIRTTLVPAEGYERALLIGINDVDEEGTFVWASGQPVTYTNWLPGQPDDAGGEDYGILFPSGEWNDQARCPYVNEGVIEVNTVPLPAVFAGPIRNPANCHDYYLTQPATWIEAQLKADSMGGDLVTINDAAENEWIRATIANYGGVERLLWVGLTDRDVEGTFEWVDGTSLGYTNWETGEPNNIGNEDYVSMVNAITGKWNDARSGAPFAGLIEIPTLCGGDMNCDNSITTADIPFFVQALLQSGGFGGCDINRADMNSDTLINGRDVQPFVAALLAP